MRYLVTVWKPPLGDADSPYRYPMRYRSFEAYLNGSEISSDYWELVSVVNVSDIWGPKFMLTFKSKATS